MSAAEAGALARRLIEVIAEPFHVEGQELVVTASVGIALAPNDGADPDTLLQYADMALYAAKTDGRRTYRFFEPGNEEGFALLDRVIGWAREDHLYVILDMHCAPGGQTGANIDDSWGYPWLYEDEASQQQAMDVWKRIAAHRE